MKDEDLDRKICQEERAMNVLMNRSIVLLVGYSSSPARDLLQSRQSIY